MDSVGCGGAPDAAAFGDEGANTLGHIAGLRRGRAERAVRAAAVPNLAAPRPRRRHPPRRDIDLPGFPETPTAHLGRRHRGLPRQGHPLRPLGAGRRPGALGLALLPAHRPGDPGLGHRAADRRAGLPGTLCNAHSSGMPVIHAFGEEHIRNGQADPLHLRRQRAADRRARDAFRPRPPLRGLPHRRGDRPPAARRPGHRPALRRRDAGDASSRTANRKDLAIPPPEPTILDRVVGGRRPHPRHRQDRRHLRPPRHLDAGQGQGRHGAGRRHARGDGRRRATATSSSPTTSTSTPSGATRATSPATPARSRPSTPASRSSSPASAPATSSSSPPTTATTRPGPAPTTPASGCRCSPPAPASPPAPPASSASPTSARPSPPTSASRRAAMAGASCDLHPLASNTQPSAPQTPDPRVAASPRSCRRSRCPST